MGSSDTIFALSTPRGKSGVAVIRISGPRAQDTLVLLGANSGIKPRVAAYKVLYNREKHAIDNAVVLYFPGPNSFTGEDVVELQVHGSNAVIKLVFSELQQICRLAEPGEFSLRAFLNGKIDLTRAEGIADLINSETEAQLKQAIAQSSGRMEELYESWRRLIMTALVKLEACIDFPEDVETGQIVGAIHDDIANLLSVLQKHLDDGNRGERLKNGARVVILGQPNAGKSTLFNCIARRNVAIVSEYPGTTRDVLEVAIEIDGYPFTVVDTAGIRESSDFIEQEGIRRAENAALEADLKILLVPYSQLAAPSMPTLEKFHDAKTIYVLSKADDVVEKKSLILDGKEFLLISAHQDRGINELLTVIKERTGDSFPGSNDVFITSQRQRGLLQNAVQILSEIDRIMPIEVIAEYLRLASQEIGRVTGVVYGESVLDDIFKKFCIGK